MNIFKEKRRSAKMKKKHVVILVSVLRVLIGLAVTVLVMTSQGKIRTAKKSDVRTWSDWTELEVFQTVPAMVVEGTKVGDAEDYGGGMYQINISGTELSDYQAYLTLLEKNGFNKYVDNGENGLEGFVYSATYTKDNLVMTVIQMVKTYKTYITVGKDIELSPNLHYDESYLADNKEGAKTSLHLMELYDNGSSFVIQLKNGHFIMNDGGLEEDLPYLLDYLESLTPGDEKPVIDAWFISHAHGDHYGWLTELVSDMDYINRIYVESFYFSEPSEKTLMTMSATGLVRNVMMNYKMLRTTEGSAPKMYRPQTGQRYYFNDITVDIVFTQEQLTAANHFGDFNDSSTWQMYTIENQKFLLSGDAADGSTKAVMESYDSEYFDLDMFAVFHHGINVYGYFTEFCTTKTVLYTNYKCGSMYTTGVHAREEENAQLMSSAKEVLAFGDGTKVLTFPYEIGTAKTMPKIEWKYHNNKHDISSVWGPRLEEYETHIINE